jgi:hypothetical protein
MERLINSDTTVIQLWNHITVRNPEDGGDGSPKRRFELELHGAKCQKASITDTP